VVDDDAEVREVTTTRLIEAGYAVREAASGLQALAALEADPGVDLVVMDFAMPGMNGAETALEVRKRWPALPVLFVTGFADTTALTKAGAVGIDGIVLKPFRVGELEGKVAAALASRPTAQLRLISGRDRSA
jgi:CheY-like chemotaxis protein